MNNSYWGVDGMIHLATKQGRREKRKKNVEKKNKIKDVCLNCTKEKCSGHCKYFNW